MGNQQSVIDSLEDVKGEENTSQGNEQGIKTVQLWVFEDQEDNKINKQVYSHNINYKFYDQNQDSDRKAPEWYFEIAQANIDLKVDDALNMTFQHKLIYRALFIFNEKIWALIFPDFEQFKNFQKDYSDKLFENTYAVEFDESGRKKVFGDMEDMFYNPDPVENNQVEEMDWEASFPQEDKPPRASQMRDRQTFARQDNIQALKIGANDRSYVVRDGVVDVLENVGEGINDLNMNFKLKTPGKTMQQQYLTPNKMMLSKMERQANFLSPNHQSKVFQADLDTSQVVREWNFSKNGVEIPMSNIQNSNKAAQLTDDETFLSIGPKSINKWDMRTPSGVVQDLTLMDGKDYASRTDFNCFATTGDGYTAVGSLDGKVRLYSDRQIRRATTQVPGLGLPITQIDVSYDGRYVVATTDRYLLVVLTIFRDKKSQKECNAFLQPGKSGMLPPKVLKLKHEDLLKVGVKSKFTGAKFSWVLQANQQEQHIVAQCGEFLVVWNFRQIKSSKDQDYGLGGLQTVANYYKIFPRGSSIVDSHFMNERNTKDPSMVIATKRNIFSVGGGLDSDSEEEKQT